MGGRVTVCSPTPRLHTARLVLGAAAKPQCFGGFGRPQGWTRPPACPDAACGFRGGQLGLQPPAPPQCLCHTPNHYMTGRQHLISYRFPSQEQPGCLLTPDWHLAASQLNNRRACQVPSSVPVPAGVPLASRAAGERWPDAAPTIGVQGLSHGEPEQGVVQTHVHTRVCTRSFCCTGRRGPPGWQANTPGLLTPHQSCSPDR